MSQTAERPSSSRGTQDPSPEPCVSVVTIFHDAERFLADSIESVLEQSFRDWELILVNDGSSDGSVAIARRYVDRFPDRLRLVEHPGGVNRGMSASRNLGISVARGRYIALLDADDVYLPGKLEHQVALLDSLPDVGVAFGRTQLWRSWTGDPADAHRDSFRSVGVPPGTIVRPPDFIPLVVRSLAALPCTCGVLMRRDAVLRAGGFEESFRGMFEDQVFFYRIFANEQVIIDGRFLDRYRQHDASWSHQSLASGAWKRGAELSASRRAFLEWLEVFLRDERLSKLGLHRQIRRELLPYRHPALAPFWRALAPFRELRTRWKRRVRVANSRE